MFMSSLPSFADPDDAAGRVAQDACHYRGVLRELIDMGADLARLVHQQAEQAVVPAAEAAVAFERITRAVRRSILLAQKLDEPARAPGADRWTARRRVIRAVEDAIQREADEGDSESLHAEFLDRLDGPDLEDDLGDRPVGEIIADICHDLGLGAMPGTHPWKRRSPADIAALCVRAAEPVRGRVWHVRAADEAGAGMLRREGQAGCRGP